MEALRSAYRDGTYIQGSYHREGICLGCGRVFPKWRTNPMAYCSRECAGVEKGYTPEQRLALQRQGRAKRKARAA
jgi:hypothetical protein